MLERFYRAEAKLASRKKTMKLDWSGLKCSFLKRVIDCNEIYGGPNGIQTRLVTDMA